MYVIIHIPIYHLGGPWASLLLRAVCGARGCGACPQNTFDEVQNSYKLNICYICVYVYMYRERERETETEIDR